MLLALLLAFVLLRDSGEATGVTPTAPAASGGLAADAATARPEPTIAPATPSAVPTDRPETSAGSAPTALAAVLAEATNLEPSTAFAGALPLVVRSDGSNLDKFRTVQFVNGSGAVTPAEVQTRAVDQLKLSIPALPEPISGEVNYALQLDGI